MNAIAKKVFELRWNAKVARLEEVEREFTKVIDDLYARVDNQIELCRKAREEESK